MTGNGYFGCFHKGDNAAWSIRDGHTYRDRSALRFDPDGPASRRPSITRSWTSTKTAALDDLGDDVHSPEPLSVGAPLFYAAYGALQGSDCIIHFALDGSRWDVKPGFWMQQWNPYGPDADGPVSGGALIYRRGLVGEGAVLADIHLKLDDLLALKGTPMPQNADFDELRLADVPKGLEVKPEIGLIR